MKAVVATIVIILAGAGIVFFLKKSNQYKTPVNTSITATSSGSNISASYTMTDISMHNNASSCWSAINEKVYNLTSWIGQHPGGENAILSICGKDGSQAFNDQHGTAKKQAQLLSTFLIGNLK